MLTKSTLVGVMASITAIVGTARTGCGGNILPGTTTDESSDATAGVLQVKATTTSLGGAALILPNAQQAPDDVDVNLTPAAYTIAFKRLVLKQLDEVSAATLAEVEVFNADTVEDALIVDLANSVSSNIFNATNLPAGTYNQVDIEVFYLDMTVSTIYPEATSHDIAYRMVYEQMGVLEPRDFLLYLDPGWMTAGSALADQVTDQGWYWMHREEPDNVVPVEGAAAHPAFPVLDLFADEAFWSGEHKVLEGGSISPPLVYDPDAGGVLTVRFDVTGKFNFKDFHDADHAADGLWEIRRDSGIHPFPPSFDAVPQSASDPDGDPDADGASGTESDPELQPDSN